uniref:Uncharacterized protein n=1 Tax=Anguilla anguilla TaxID=7936 RepID=A0A0E9PD37_ANGAN
MVRMVWSEGG